MAGGVSYCGETTKPSSSAGFAIPRSSFLVCSRALPVLSSACSNMVGDTLTTSPASPRPSTASSSTTSIRRLCALLGCGSSRYPSSLTFVAALRPLCLFSALAFDLRRASVFCRAKTSARATNGKRRSMRNVAAGTRRRALPSTQQCTRMIARIIVARCRQSHSLRSTIAGCDEAGLCLTTRVRALMEISPTSNFVKTGSCQLRRMSLTDRCPVPHTTGHTGTQAPRVNV